MQLDGREDFEFTIGRTAGAVLNTVRSTTLFQGGTLKQGRLTFTDYEILSTGEFTFVGASQLVSTSRFISPIINQFYIALNLK